MLNLNPVALTVSDVVFNPRVGKVLAGVTGASKSFARSIVAVDPETGEIGAPIPLEDEPGKFAISDRGEYLYVGLMTTGGVARIDLSRQAVDLRFVTSTELAYQTTEFFVEDMAVVPGHPESVAIAYRIAFADYHIGAAVYDDGVARPDWLRPGPIDVGYRLTFDPAAGFLYIVYPSTLNRVQLTPTGLKIVSGAGGWDYGGDLRYAAGWLYSSSGYVYAPKDLGVVGTLPVSGPMAVSSDGERVWCLATNRIVAMEARSQRPVARLILPPALQYSTGIADCGEDRLALIDSKAALTLLHSHLLPPKEATDLGLAQSLGTVAPRPQEALEYALTVTNRGPSRSTLAVLNDLLPAGCDFLAAATSQGSVTVTNGLLRWVLGPLDSAAQASLSLRVVPRAPDVVTNVAWVEGASLNTADDRSELAATVRLDPERPGCVPFDLRVADMTYDSVSNKLYVISAGLDRADDRIVAIDLRSGLVDLDMAVGAPAHNLEVTGDGQSLYFGVELAEIDGIARTATDVYRYRLAEGRIDQRFPVTDYRGNREHIGCMALMSGTTNTLAIARWHFLVGTGTGLYDIAIYEDGVPTRRTSESFYCRDLLASRTAGRFYAMSNSGVVLPVYSRLEVQGTNMVTLASEGGSPRVGHSPLAETDRYLLTDEGEAIDALTMAHAGRLPVHGVVQADPSRGLIWFLTPQPSDWALSAWDWHTLRLVGTYPVAGLTGDALGMVRCGDGYLAVNTTSNKLYLINIAPLARTAPVDLSLSQSVSANFAQPGEILEFSAVLKNSGAPRATGIVITNLISANAVLESLTSTSGTGRRGERRRALGFGQPGSGRACGINSASASAGNRFGGEHPWRHQSRAGQRPSRQPDRRLRPRGGTGGDGLVPARPALSRSRLRPPAAHDPRGH